MANDDHKNGNNKQDKKNYSFDSFASERETVATPAVDTSTVKENVKSNPIQTTYTPPAAQTAQKSVAPQVKSLDPRIARLMQFIRIYKDKVAEYKKTKSDSVKLWKHFWDIGNYVLESNKQEVIDTFFREFVHDEDLNTNTLALRLIYECKDGHVKNKVCAFYQVMASFQRYFKDKSKNGSAKCFISVRAVARTFENAEEFVKWVNLKKSI